MYNAQYICIKQNRDQQVNEEITTILSNLAMLDDGLKYLNEINAQETLIKMIVDHNNNNENNEKNEDYDKVIFSALKTLIQINPNIDTLIANGNIVQIQNLITNSNNINITKEGLNWFGQHIDTLIGQNVIDANNMNVCIIYIFFKI